MADSDQITCRIAFWYYRRMAMIITLLTAGGLWFVYDGAVGWPKKNVVALAKEAFEAGRADTSWDEYTAKEGSHYLDAELDDEEAIALIKEAHGEGSKAVPWEEFALSATGKDSLAAADEASVRAVFDAGAVSGAEWAAYATENNLPLTTEDAESAEGGVDRFAALNSAFLGAGKKREWGLYGVRTERKNWGEDVKYHTKSEVQGQYAFAYGLWAIAAAMLVWTIINSRRKLSADADSLTTETGVRVPFTDVFRIDKRKWDNKGLGYAFYRTEGGGEKRAILDDLKYIGTDKILERLMANFEGELIERAVSEEDASDEAVEGGADDDSSEKLPEN